MMISTRPRRTREVTGPTPHSVAIFARPINKKPPEQLILDRRRQEDLREQAEMLTKYNKLWDMKTDWERQTDRKIQTNTVHRRVQARLQEINFTVEDRKERLRNLLKAEEAQYVEEMASQEETVLERQAKMREKAKKLKEERETSRLTFVQEKLDQQWRSQCEELRSTISKRQQDVVAAERVEQLREQEQRRRDDAERERLYDDLWHENTVRKARREEEDTRRQMALNQQTLEVLQQQIAAMATHRDEELRLKQEEAELLKTQAALRRLEEQHAAEEKKRRQEETRRMYDRSRRLKAAREAREMQEQLAFDMRMLEQLLEESRNEAMEQAQRKKELRAEDQSYRQYLAKIKTEAAELEKELDRICDEEVEKSWQKRLAQWRLEKEARQKLLQDVLESRRQQIQEKIDENQSQAAQAARDRAALADRLAENQRVEAALRDTHAQKRREHRDELRAQIDYNKQERRLAADEQRREWQRERDAELEHRRKVELALATAEPERAHPSRRRRADSTPASRHLSAAADDGAFTLSGVKSAVSAARSTATPQQRQQQRNPLFYC